MVGVGRREGGRREGGTRRGRGGVGSYIRSSLHKVITKFLSFLCLRKKIQQIEIIKQNWGSSIDTCMFFTFL